MRFAYILLLIFALSDTDHAQVVGASLGGTVSDASGGGLPEASVAIRNTETGALRTGITDSAGRYSFPSIPVGMYQVTVTKEGFSSQVRKGIGLEVGQHTTADCQLEVGEKTGCHS